MVSVGSGIAIFGVWSACAIISVFVEYGLVSIMYGVIATYSLVD